MDSFRGMQVCISGSGNIQTTNNSNKQRTPAFVTIERKV